MSVPLQAVSACLLALRRLQSRSQAWPRNLLPAVISPGFGDPVNIDRLPPRPVGRIAVHCLGGAAWQLGQQDGHHAEREVYRAMLTLKQAVRRSRCAAMVTVPRGGVLSQNNSERARGCHEVCSWHTTDQQSCGATTR